MIFPIINVRPWCGGYLYCTTSFNNAWTQVLHRFNPVCGVPVIRDGEDLWQWIRLEIRLNTFHRWTTLQKQFIIIIIIIIIIETARKILQCKSIDWFLYNGEHWSLNASLRRAPNTLLKNFSKMPAGRLYFKLMTVYPKFCKCDTFYYQFSLFAKVFRWMISFRKLVWYNWV